MKQLILMVTIICLASIPAIALEPGQFDIIMRAGEDFQLDLILVDSAGTAVDITGNSYAAQFRSTSAPTGIVFATYSAVVVDPAAGSLRVNLSRSQTTRNSGKIGVWDLKQTDSLGHVLYLLSGTNRVKQSATP